MNILKKYRKEIIVSLFMFLCLIIFFGFVGSPSSYVSKGDSFMLPEMNPELGSLNRLMKDRGLTKQEMEKLILLQEQHDRKPKEFITVRTFLKNVHNNREQFLRDKLKAMNYTQEIINLHIEAVKNNDPYLLIDQ